jgi:hypothetical protein
MVFPVPEQGTKTSDYHLVVTQYELSSAASMRPTERKGNNALHSINIQQRHSLDATTFILYFDPQINYGTHDDSPTAAPSGCNNKDFGSSIASDASITFVLLPARFLQPIDGIQMSKP